MELSQVFLPHNPALCRSGLLRGASFPARLACSYSSKVLSAYRSPYVQPSGRFTACFYQSFFTRSGCQRIKISTIRFVSSTNATTTEEDEMELALDSQTAGSTSAVGVLAEVHRNPLQQDGLNEERNDLGDYLVELKDFKRKLESMIEQGDMETPAALVQANYKALREQMNQGNKSLEQAAMLDTLIEASLMLQDVKHVQEMLDQMKDILFNMEKQESFLHVFLEHMGNVYLALGNKQEAISCYNKSISIQESIVGENSPELVDSLLAIAGVYTEPNEREIAKPLYNRVVHILEHSGVTSEELVTPLLHLGYIFLEEKKSDEAELLMRRALDVAQNTSETGGSVGVATCGLARVKYVKGDHSKAAELYQNGLAMLKKSGLWASSDLALESIFMEAAEFFSVVGRTKDAQSLWEEVLHEKERAVGVNSPKLVVHLQNLATSYAQDGRFDKCEPLLRRSLKLITASLGPNAPQVSIPLEYLATTLHHLDQNKEAESLARQALSIRERNYPDDHLLIGEACNILAAILHENSRNEEALKLVQRALRIKEKHLGKDSQQLGIVLDLMLEIMDVLGKSAEALPVINRLERLLGQSSKANP